MSEIEELRAQLDLALRENKAMKEMILQYGSQGGSVFADGEGEKCYVDMKRLLVSNVPFSPEELVREADGPSITPQGWANLTGTQIIPRVNFIGVELPDVKSLADLPAISDEADAPTIVEAK